MPIRPRPVFGENLSGIDVRLIVQREKQIAMHLGKIRPEPNGLTKGRYGVVRLARVLQDAAQIAVRLGQIRLEPNGLAKGGNGLVESPIVLEDVSEI